MIMFHSAMFDLLLPTTIEFIRFFEKAKIVPKRQYRYRGARVL